MEKKISIDSLYERCEMLYDYCTKSYKYNHFIIDEVNEEWERIKEMNLPETAFSQYAQIF